MCADGGVMDWLVTSCCYVLTCCTLWLGRKDDSTTTESRAVQRLLSKEQDDDAQHIALADILNIERLSCSSLLVHLRGDRRPSALATTTQSGTFVLTVIGDDDDDDQSYKGKDGTAHGQSCSALYNALLERAQAFMTAYQKSTKRRASSNKECSWMSLSRLPATPGQAEGIEHYTPPCPDAAACAEAEAAATAATTPRGTTTPVETRHASPVSQRHSSPRHSSLEEDDACGVIAHGAQEPSLAQQYRTVDEPPVGNTTAQPRRTEASWRTPSASTSRVKEDQGNGEEQKHPFETSVMTPTEESQSNNLPTLYTFDADQEQHSNCLVPTSQTSPFPLWTPVSAGQSAAMTDTGRRGGGCSSSSAASSDAFSVTPVPLRRRPPLPVGAGLGAAVSVLIRTSGADKPPRQSKGHSVASGDSDFSYTSLLRPISTISTLCANRHQLQTPPEREGAESKASSSERRNARDLMSRVWRPMGRTAQDILVSEWERREREERQQLLLEALTDHRSPAKQDIIEEALD